MIFTRIWSGLLRLFCRNNSRVNKMNKISIEESEKLLNSLRAKCKLTQDEVNEIVVAMEQCDLTLQEWEDFLADIPSNIVDRYNKMIDLLLKDNLIDEETANLERQATYLMSPKQMVRNGKYFNEIRNKELDYRKRW